MHIFTSNDLLLYYFNELTPCDKIQVEKQLASSISFRNEYLDLRSNLEFVEKINFKAHSKLQNYVVQEIEKTYELNFH